MFPDYFGKDTTKSLFDLSFKQLEPVRILVGVQNNDDYSTFRIKNITGSLTEDSITSTSPNYIQNFTIDSFDNGLIHPTESYSIAFDFFAYTSIKVQPYKLLIVVFYEDQMFEFSSVVFNGMIQIEDSGLNVGASGLFSMMLTTGMLLSVGFIAFIKIRERISGVPENKRKKGTNPNMLDRIKDAISV